MPIKELTLDYSEDDKVVIKGGTIYKGKENIGHIIYDRPYATTRIKYMSYGSYTDKDLKRIGKILDKQKVPDKFMATFVSEIKLFSKYRGKGLGEQVFNALFATFKKPTVVLLNPGEITKAVKIESLLRFYKKMGFTTFTEDTEHLALKCVKP